MKTMLCLFLCEGKSNMVSPQESHYEQVAVQHEWRWRVSMWR